MNRKLQNFKALKSKAENAAADVFKKAKEILENFLQNQEESEWFAENQISKKDIEIKDLNQAIDDVKADISKKDKEIARLVKLLEDKKVCLDCQTKNDEIVRL